MSDKTNLIVGLDIGTSKVVAIVGEVNSSGELEIIGIGAHRSSGLKKGVVVNIESTVQSIQRAIEEAKQKAHWDVLMDENFAEHGYTAEFCVSEIDQISDWSLEVLAKLQDHDLGRLFGYENREGERIEKSLRWILHHLIDHEAQHKGQILMLKRLLRENK